MTPHDQIRSYQTFGETHFTIKIERTGSSETSVEVHSDNVGRIFSEKAGTTYKTRSQHKPHDYNKIQPLTRPHAVTNHMTTNYNHLQDHTPSQTTWLQQNTTTYKTTRRHKPHDYNKIQPLTGPHAVTNHMTIKYNHLQDHTPSRTTWLQQNTTTYKTTRRHKPHDYNKIQPLTRPHAVTNHMTIK
jgi:hypothetical protein